MRYLRNLWCKLFHDADWTQNGMHRKEYRCMVCKRIWAEVD